MLVQAYNLITNKINRSMSALVNAMVTFSKNTYISAEHSIHHLQSKLNDKKAYIEKL